MAVKSKKVIRESLISQLRAKGADVDHFEALIDEYIFDYETVRKMKADIRKKGLCYTAVSAAGKVYEKDNPNVKMVPVYQRSMLMILKDLGLTTDKIDIDNEEL